MGLIIDLCNPIATNDINFSRVEWLWKGSNWRSEPHVLDGLCSLGCFDWQPPKATHQSTWIIDLPRIMPIKSFNFGIRDVLLLNLISFKLPLESNLRDQSHSPTLWGSFEGLEQVFTYSCTGLKRWNGWLKQNEPSQPESLTPSSNMRMRV